MVKVLHVGAGHCEEYSTYVNKGVEQVIYVEAAPHLVTKNRATISACNKRLGREDKIYHRLLWRESGVPKKFRMFNNDTFSSVYDINPKEWIWHNIKNCGWDVELETQTLNDFLEAEGINPEEYECMAIDVQGAEYDVFVGGEKYLENVKCLKFEASTKEFYEGQKTYGEIKEYLEGQGFVVEDIPSHHYDVYAIRPGYESYREWLEHP